MTFGALLASGTIPTGCSSVLCIDVTQGAGWYSALGGLLAGFSFLAITQLIQGHGWTTRDPTESGARGSDRARASQALQNVVVCFVAAFLALFIATLLWIQVSRQDLNSARTLTLGFVAAVGLAVGVLNLLYGVVWMFTTWHLRFAAAVMGRLTAVVIPGLIYLYLGVAATDMLSVSEGQAVSFATMAWLVILPFLVIEAVAFVTNRQRFDPFTRQFAGDGAVRATAYGSLAVAVLTALASGAVSFFGQDSTLPRWATYLILIMLFFALALYMLLIQAVRHRLPDGDVEHVEGPIST